MAAKRSLPPHFTAWPPSALYLPTSQHGHQALFTSLFHSMAAKRSLPPHFTAWPPSALSKLRAASVIKEDEETSYVTS